MSLGSEEEPWSSGSQTSSEDPPSWIKWWSSHQGHEYFAEVPEEFIEDDFNMTGLIHEVEFYQEALELILDLQPSETESFEAADQDSVEGSAEILYALVHQRYICSRPGLQVMAEKYEVGHFGMCPRTLCHKMSVLPIGLSPDYGDGVVKLFCPSCLDVYNPPNSRFYDVDGSYFGPTFPHLFFMTFPELRPPVIQSDVPSVYVPRIYGFKVSERAVCGPKMAWLRQCVYSGQVNAAETEAHGMVEDAKPVKRTDTSLTDGSRQQQSQTQLTQTRATSPTSSKRGSSKNGSTGQITSSSRSKEAVKPLVAVRETRPAS